MTLDAKKADQAAKQKVYDVTDKAYTEAKKKLDEAQATYDAYYTDKELTWEEIEKTVTLPITKKEDTITVKVPVCSSQYAKDLTNAIIEMEKARKDLENANVELKGAVKDVKNAFGAHSEAVKELGDAVEKLNKAAGSVILEAAKLGVEDIKLAGAVIANDAVLAAGEYLKFVQGKVDAAYQEAEQAKQALETLQNKVNVSDEELAEAKMRLDIAETNLAHAQAQLETAKKDAQTVADNLTKAQTDFDKIKTIQAWNATVKIGTSENPSEGEDKKPEGGVTGKPQTPLEDKGESNNSVQDNDSSDSENSTSSSSTSSSNKSSSNSTVATLTLINDEAPALAATLEDTTFAPEFTTIEDEATALSDTITTDAESIMKTGDTSNVPMVVTILMTMGVVSIAGAYGYRKRFKRTV